ncbi:MAG: glycosyltransferase family 39 protein [Cyanobacteria bacterium K_DeepCast_35m_m2_023]|nr:glycosyltransferase family 39 protein [Cyanobacteria bacterium K_DeepCast_35m_m2_023]
MDKVQHLWRQHWPLLVSLASGIALFVWGLGQTGLVDETPPLFAASARAMAESGDWLIPRVNGLPRYDKPPLVYWLMGLGYLLPAQAQWNPLGTWAARLPSALASIAVMVALTQLLRRWPQPGVAGDRRRTALTAVGAALSYGLSPLSMLWGRLAVSDALFAALLGLSLLLFWHSQARRATPPGRTGQGWRGWWHGWLVLGLAVLTKGPLAVVLVGLTLLAFAGWQGELRRQLRGLCVWRGLGITAAVALPWYGLALLVEGEPYWRSFFGYHNLQRFTSVVNDHLQPWWFFGPILVAASLPASPLLLLGLARALRTAAPPAPDQSLARFASCWLLVVLGFFTLAATKLPSYWIPATPAAAVLIALTAGSPPRAGCRRWPLLLAWSLSLLLAVMVAAVLLLAPLWFTAVNDPEMPTLAKALLASGLLQRAGLLWALAALAPLLLWRNRGQSPWRLLELQLPLLGFALLALQPLWALGDRLRGLPVRQMAAAVDNHRRPAESLAMVGVLKPSLHYYSRRVVLYEGNQPADLANLADRLGRERRRGQQPSSARQQPTVLVVIDAGTASLPYWQGLGPERLASAGIYQLWRLQRSPLEARAAELARRGIGPTWQRPRPERY